MIYVYVGDSRDVVKRIIVCHCNGNVEASALRKAVAEAMGYRLKKSRRESGSIRVRIDLPNPNEGEAKSRLMLSRENGNTLSANHIQKHTTSNGM